MDLAHVHSDHPSGGMKLESHNIERKKRSFTWGAEEVNELVPENIARLGSLVESEENAKEFIEAKSGCHVLAIEFVVQETRLLECNTGESDATRCWYIFTSRSKITKSSTSPRKYNTT